MAKYPPGTDRAMDPVGLECRAVVPAPVAPAERRWRYRGIDFPDGVSYG